MDAVLSEIFGTISWTHCTPASCWLQDSEKAWLSNAENVKCCAARSMSEFYYYCYLFVEFSHCNCSSSSVSLHAIAVIHFIYFILFYSVSPLIVAFCSQHSLISTADSTIGNSWVLPVSSTPRSFQSRSLIFRLGSITISTNAIMVYSTRWQSV